jgi:hypothetical protein
VGETQRNGSGSDAAADVESVRTQQQEEEERLREAGVLLWG